VDHISHFGKGKKRRSHPGGRPPSGKKPQDSPIFFKEGGGKIPFPLKGIPRPPFFPSGGEGTSPTRKNKCRFGGNTQAGEEGHVLSGKKGGPVADKGSGNKCPPEKKNVLSQGKKATTSLSRSGRGKGGPLEYLGSFP